MSWVALSCWVHKPTMRELTMMTYHLVWCWLWELQHWRRSGCGPWNLLSRDKAGKYPTAGIMFRKFCGFRRMDIPLNCLFLYPLCLNYFCIWAVLWCKWKTVIVKKRKKEEKRKRKEGNTNGAENTNHTLATISICIWSFPGTSFSRVRTQT